MWECLFLLWHTMKFHNGHLLYLGAKKLLLFEVAANGLSLTPARVFNISGSDNEPALFDQNKHLASKLTKHFDWWLFGILLTCCSGDAFLFVCEDISNLLTDWLYWRWKWNEYNWHWFYFGDWDNEDLKAAGCCASARMWAIWSSDVMEQVWKVEKKILKY